MPVWEPSKPVLSPSKGGPRTPARRPAAPPAELRVNVAKCRKMSHFFIPPLGECRTLRVKNLTFLAHSRPFGPISVHFPCSSTEGGAQTAASGRLAVDTGRARGSIAARDGGEAIAMTTEQQGSERRVRIGFVGIGMGASMILYQLDDLPQFEMAAGADVNPRVREAFHDRYPDAQVYDDADKLFADPDVEAVWIATPNQFHAPMAVAAARQGKHVVIEKPMALSIEDGLRMIEAAEDNHVSLLCGHTLGFSPQVRAMRRVIKSGTPRRRARRQHLGLHRLDGGAPGCPTRLTSRRAAASSTAGPAPGRHGAPARRRHRSDRARDHRPVGRLALRDARLLPPRTWSSTMAPPPTSSTTATATS